MVSWTWQGADLSVQVTSPSKGAKFKKGSTVTMSAKVTCTAPSPFTCTPHTVGFKPTNSAIVSKVGKASALKNGQSYTVTKSFTWQGGLNADALAEIYACPSSKSCAVMGSYTPLLQGSLWYMDEVNKTNNTSKLDVMSYSSIKSFSTSKTIFLTQSGQDLKFTLDKLPYNPVGTTVSVKVQVYGDYGGSTEYAKVYVKTPNGGSSWSTSYLGTVGNESGGDCNKSGKTKTWNVPASKIVGGKLYIDVNNESAVTKKNSCSSGQKAVVTVTYSHYQ